MNDRDNAIEEAIVGSIAALRHLAGEVEVEMSEYLEIPDGLNEIWTDIAVACDRLDDVAEAQGIDLEAFDFSDPSNPKRNNDINS